MSTNRRKLSQCKPHRQESCQFCEPHPRNRGCERRVWPGKHDKSDKYDCDDGVVDNEGDGGGDKTTSYFSNCQSWFQLTLSLLISFTSSLWNRSPASELKSRLSCHFIHILIRLGMTMDNLLSITASLSSQPGKGSTMLTLLFIFEIVDRDD